MDRLWCSLLGELGICAANVLRRAELPRDLFSQAAARLNLEEYFRLWRAVEAEAGEMSVALGLALAVRPTVFHPPLFAGLCSPNLLVAAKRIGEYRRLTGTSTWTIEEGPSGITIREDWDEGALVLPDTLAILEPMFLTQLARLGTREPIGPVELESPHSTPLACFESFFGILPRRGRRPSVTFSAEHARRPFLTADDSLWEAFGPQLRRRVTKLDAAAPLQQRVRSVLLESLPSGEASIEFIARCLGSSARTLQRRLRREGASFKEVVGETREQLACHYLTRTSLAYHEISFLLGFEEPSSFFRAFRERTGKTPEAVRHGAGQELACVAPGPVTSCACAAPDEPLAAGCRSSGGKANGGASVASSPAPLRPTSSRSVLVR